VVDKFLYHKHKVPEVFLEVFSAYFTLSRSVHNYTTRTGYNLHLKVRTHPQGKNDQIASQLWNELPTTVKTVKSPKYLNIN